MDLYFFKIENTQQLDHITGYMDPIYFKKLNPNATIPTRGTPNSAGFDLYALEDITINASDGVHLVRTGIAVRLPHGTYGRIAMRSGLAVRQHLSVSAGVIDKDYSGDVGVAVYCTRPGYAYKIKAGERFAQLIPEKVYYGPAQEVEELPTVDSSHEGFGSTGKF